MWKYTQKHFKDDLAAEKNKMVLVYGIILLSCIAQTLFFLVEIKVLFCQTEDWRFINTIVSFLWNLPLTVGVCYLHHTNYAIPAMIEYPAAVIERQQEQIEKASSQASMNSSRNELDQPLAQQKTASSSQQPDEMLEETFGEMDVTYVEEGDDDDRIMQWRLFEI